MENPYQLYTQLRDEHFRSPASVYLMESEEGVLRREFLTRLRRALSIQPGSIDESVLDARETPLQTVLLQVQVAPMESERRLIILNAVDRYSANDHKALAEFIPKIPPFTCLVLATSTGGDDSPPNTASWQALVKAVAKHGKALQFKPLKGDLLVKRLIAEAESQGKHLTREQANLLLELVDGVAERALSELQKVILYVGSQPTITNADILQVVSPSQQAQVFALVDALIARDAPNALRQLQLLFQTGTPQQETALKTLGLIARQYRILWSARTLLEWNQRLDKPNQIDPNLAQKLLREPDVLQILSKQPYLRERIQKQAECITWSQLCHAFESLRLADLALKGLQPGVNPAEIMERLIIKLTTSAN